MRYFSSLSTILVLSMLLGLARSEAEIKIWYIRRNEIVKGSCRKSLENTLGRLEVLSTHGQLGPQLKLEENVQATQQLASSSSQDNLIHSSSQENLIDSSQGNPIGSSSMDQGPKKSGKGGSKKADPKKAEASSVEAGKAYVDSGLMVMAQKMFSECRQSCGYQDNMKNEVIPSIKEAITKDASLFVLLGFYRVEGWFEKKSLAPTAQMPPGGLQTFSDMQEQNGRILVKKARKQYHLVAKLTTEQYEEAGFQMQKQKKFSWSGWW